MSEIYFYSIAKNLLTEGKLLEARIACLRVLNLQPKSADACKLMGDIMQAKGKIAAAKYWYDRSLKLNHHLASSHANLGSIYAREKQWELAISCYQNALDIDPNFAGFYRNLAKVWQQVGKQDLMVECWQRAVTLEPEKITGADYLILADNLLELGRKDEAITYYRWALKFDSNLSKAYQELGTLLVETGELEEAIAMFLQLINLHPHEALFYKNLGDAFRKKQQLERAIAAYDMAVKLKPDNDLFQKKLGDALQEKGNLNEAITCYQKAIEINQNFSGSYRQLGNAFRKQSRWNEAAAAYRKEIAIKPNSSYPYSLLGNVLIHQLETLDEAVAAYLKAIELEPEYPWFTNYSVWNSIIKQGKIQKLLKFYRRATKLNPDSVWCYVNLAEILTAKGKIQGAIKSYQKACYNKTQKSHPEFVEKHWVFPQSSGPDFIIIGAQKSGTTSLENYIAQHPQILPAIKKEIHFWYRDFDKGIPWYLAHFPPIPKSVNYLTGEATPNYLENWQSASRIYQILPDVKLLVILRNPVDRAISQYYHWLRLKRENRSFEAAMNEEIKQLKQTPHLPVGDKNYWQEQKSYLGRGIYVEFLQKWLEIFPRKQFLIIRGEDLYQRPAATMKQVFDFLDLPEHKLSEYKKLNPGYYQPIDESTRQILSDFFQPHNQKLEKFLGIKFNWS